MCQFMEHVNAIQHSTLPTNFHVRRRRHPIIYNALYKKFFNKNLIFTNIRKVFMCNFVYCNIWCSSYCLAYVIYILCNVSILFVWPTPFSFLLCCPSYLLFTLASKFTQDTRYLLYIYTWCSYRCTFPSVQTLNY